MSRTTELEYGFSTLTRCWSLHSDGLTGQWSLDKYAGLRQRHPDD